jgi:hypothetical protein
MPQTVDAVVLLGWMERDDAVRVLCNECVFDPPLTENQAAEIWQRYRDAVNGLPERLAVAPANLPLTAIETQQAQAFLRSARAAGAQNIRDVLKIDVGACVVHQLVVVTERARNYAQQMRNNEAKIRHCLGMHAVPVTQYQIATGPNAVNVQIPHAEFLFTFLNPGGFAVQEMAKQITVTSFDRRLLLWAGYHRSFALMMNEYPDGMDRSLIVALTTDADFILSSHSPNQGVRDMLRGLRPPLFVDFFDERFFIAVRLRKKRCELHIRAKVEWINVD